MITSMRSLAFAAASFVATTFVVPAYAVTAVPNSADFSVTESPGQYTVTNNSSIWYIYGFAVSNPDAATPGVTASTDFKNWLALSPNPSLDLNTGTPQPAFAYASQDANLSNLNNPTLSVINLGNYIAPGSFSDRFFFGSTQLASNFGLLVFANVGGVNIFTTVNGVATDASTSGNTPLPAALPLFASGAGVLGFVGWRKKRKAQALPA
jgi:hypothetical protein